MLISDENILDVYSFEPISKILQTKFKDQLLKPCYLCKEKVYFSDDEERVSMYRYQIGMNYVDAIRKFHDLGIKVLINKR